MKRPFSPLVWLCAVGAAALGALTVYDPGGVYSDYAAQLGEGTPPVAAVFAAAQDGVYPWDILAPDAEPPADPTYRPLTETVTDEEMRSSVGNNEPFADSGAAPLPLPSGSESGTEQPGDTLTPSVEVIRSDEQAQEPPAEADDPTAGFVAVDENWFDDAVFIGDSHIEGFCDYAGLRNATYYYKRGLDIWSVLKKPFVGGKLTIPQALSQNHFGKIYIMLGINEIGCGTTESYAEQYAYVIGQLRELQPDALIYIQAIFHTSQKKSDSSIYNNDTINARNEAISRIADGEHVFFIDCNTVFDDENGALTASYSGDGVHVKAPYYTMWRDYLLLFGRTGAGAATVAEPVSEDAVEPESPVSAAPAAKPAALPKPIVEVVPAPAAASVPTTEDASEPESFPVAESAEEAEATVPAEAVSEPETATEPAQEPDGQSDGEPFVDGTEEQFPSSLTEEDAAEK